MFCQVTRQSHAKSLPDFVDKAMPVLIITILEIVDVAQENFDTGQCVEVSFHGKTAIIQNCPFSGNQCEGLVID